jgi:prophage regulatory protein
VGGDRIVIFVMSVNRHSAFIQFGSELIRAMECRIGGVVEATGETRSTIYKRIAEGEFPKPVKLGAKSVGWVEDEIAVYNEARIAKRDAEAA